MICDAEREVAVAGVMGGENSEVSDDTKNILIESAYFNPTSIRRTSKDLMLTTDSSYRFERGTDPSITVHAAERAAKLIAELGDGKIAKGVIDVYPNKIYNKELKLRLARVTKLLGYEVNKNDVKRILQKLGINILKDLGDSLEVVVPNFRPDIEREVDLIEEIARIAGYDSIPTISKITITLDKKVDESEFTDKVRSSAIAIGLNEIVNNPLVPEKFAEIIGNPIKVTNPQSNDMAFLRTSLVPSALNIVSNNIKRGEKDLAFFEIGNIFNRINDGEVKRFEDFNEEADIILLLTGYKTFRKWYSQSENYDFYALKGLVNSFLKKISLDNSLIDSYNDVQNSIYEYNFAKSLNKSVLGYGGKVKSSVLKKFDIDQEVFCFEFNLMKLSNISYGNKTYSVPLKFPKVNKDFAFIFDSNIPYDEVNSFIKKSASPLLKSVSLFDLFEKGDIEENKKSMAFNLEYYDFNRTLTEDEVDKDFQNLITLITNKFNATLRGN
jgi:phenylalanyl-tRNA synthetase beta chain